MRQLIVFARRYYALLSASPLLQALAGFVIALAVILGALGSQFIGGIAPCELCYVQRWPYYVGLPILAAVLALWTRLPARPRLLLTLLVALIFVVSVGLAAYHAGVEWKFWAGPTACTGPGETLAFSDLGNLKSVEVVPCDAPNFRLFGLSLAGYNALASLVVAGLLLWSGYGQGRRATGGRQ